ncbi:mannose-1-phosphate guanylyltransferase, partial [Sulfitobacter sp. 1A16808]
MTHIVHPILLAGGSGTRLWPLSRKSYPKQFAKLMGEHSLFQASAKRLAGAGFAAPVILTGADYRFVVTEQLAAMEIAAAGILIEPDGRNTAPAILAAALELAARAPEALMLVAPSDHVIPDAAGFRAAVQAATSAAFEGQLVTFGIRPDRAETGYGWLEMSQAPSADFAAEPQPLKGFVEKPDSATAEALLQGGQHLWNAGIFLFSVQAIIAAFEAHAPEMLSLVRASVEQAEQDLGFTRLAPKPWSQVEDISIDYAVMEKAENLSVVPYGGSWSDLGGWDAVWRETGPDEAGVVVSDCATAID